MGKSPPLAPSAPNRDPTVYIVLDDFGRFGRAYRETDEAEADEMTIIDNLLSGQYSRYPYGSGRLALMSSWR